MNKIINSKKFKIIFCWLIFLFLILSSLRPYLVQAQASKALEILGITAKEAGYQAPQDPILMVVRVINWFLTLLGVIFILIIIYCGLLWMTGFDMTTFSIGNEEQIKKAKTTIKNAFIGLVLVVLAKVLYYFVIERLQGAAGEHEAIIR